MEQENISYQGSAEREDLGPIEFHIPKKLLSHPHAPPLFPKERKERKVSDAKQTILFKYPRKSEKGRKLH